MSSSVSLAAASSLAFLYVGSLYVWKTDNKDRDHPHTIRRRFLSAFCTVIASPVVVYFFGDEELLKYGLLHTIGLRLDGLVPSLILPLGLTVILFFGPICVGLSSETSSFRIKSRLWRYYLRDLMFWRNYIVAPFTEEFTFRACMIPILKSSFGSTSTILISPMLFGVAHFHHMIEKMRLGTPFLNAFLVALFQFTYTTIFGIFSAYIFLKTGHLSSTVVIHSFCNFMGFPDFAEVLRQKPTRRMGLMLAYVCGLAGFCWLFNPLTLDGRNLYSNYLYDF